MENIPEVLQCTGIFCISLFLSFKRVMLLCFQLCIYKTNQSTEINLSVKLLLIWESVVCLISQLFCPTEDVNNGTVPIQNRATSYIAKAFHPWPWLSWDTCHEFHAKIQLQKEGTSCSPVSRNMLTIPVKLFHCSSLPAPCRHNK